MREREKETDLRKILGGGYRYYREPQPLNFATQQVSVLLMRPTVRMRARRQYTGSHDQIVIIYKYTGSRDQIVIIYN